MIAEETTRDAWLDWRREGVGASDVAGILGISPWASPWSVWADKQGLTDDLDQTEAMEFGHYAEAMVGPWFQDRTGLWVVGEQTCCIHPIDTVARCTVDGFVTDNPETTGADTTDSLGVLEIKTANWGRPWDEVPAHYQAQAQWQMHVTGAERVWFAVLMGRRLDVHELARDDTDIAFMVDRVRAFWDAHVTTGEPPPTDGHDATLAALAQVYDHPQPQGVEVDLDLVYRWHAAKARTKAAQADENEAKAAVEAALGDHEDGIADGQLVVSWREQTRKEHTIKESTFRVLRDHIKE